MPWPKSPGGKAKISIFTDALESIALHLLRGELRKKL